MKDSFKIVTAGVFVGVTAVSVGAESPPDLKLYTLNGDHSGHYDTETSSSAYVSGWAPAPLNGFISEAPTGWREDALAGSRGKLEMVRIYTWPR